MGIGGAEKEKESNGKKTGERKDALQKSPLSPLSGHRSMTLDRDPQHSSPLTGSFSSHYTTPESENLQTERTLAVIWSNHCIVPSNTQSGPVLPMCPYFPARHTEAQRHRLQCKRSESWH